jgi:HlyD family secretion protein
LKQKIENEKKNVSAELQVQNLELSIFEKTLGESARLLKDARILSPQKATLTFINSQIGAQVSQGEQIAIVSDLTRFKVKGEVAGTYAEKMVLGAKAIVEVGNEKLTGTVVNIIPSLENGILNFTVLLDDASNKNLRSGLKTSIYVGHGITGNVMRIPNGPYFKNGKGYYNLWVINGGKAEKKKVLLGDNSFEYVEVVNGLNPGDKVILDDMERYKNNDILKIKQ